MNEIQKLEARIEVLEWQMKSLAGIMEELARAGREHAELTERHLTWHKRAECSL